MDLIRAAVVKSEEKQLFKLFWHKGGMKMDENRMKMGQQVLLHWTVCRENLESMMIL